MPERTACTEERDWIDWIDWQSEQAKGLDVQSTVAGPQSALLRIVCLVPRHSASEVSSDADQRQATLGDPKLYQGASVAEVNSDFIARHLSRRVPRP